MDSSFVILLGLLIAFEYHVACQDEWEFFAHEPYHVEVGYQKNINATIEDKDLSIPANIKSSCSRRYSPTGKGNFIIDLHYERSVYYYVIDVDHGGSQTKIRAGSNAAVDQNKRCATDENCHGQKGQYFAIIAENTITWQICSVYLKSVYLKAPGPKSGNPIVMSASYIKFTTFYGSHYNNLVFSSGIISGNYGTNILYSIDDPAAPTTWVTAKLDQVSLVESFWYKRANYGSSTTTVTVAHQVYSAAQFLFYKENGNTKKFSLPNTSENYKEHQFTIPFIARHVRFHLFFDQVIPLVAFLLGVKKASYPVISHHHIASETFSPPFSATLLMKLKNKQLITSVAVMSQTLYSYCISYEYNSKQYTHKINPSQTEGSIFFSNQEIALSSFHSKKVTFGCLVWYDSGVSDITVHLKGLKRNQPDHLWHQSYLISTTSDRAFGTQRYPDYSNSNFSLIGTTENFRKVAPEHVVKSNFIAGDALTQPDLGSFSIGFQMKSKMSIKPDKLTLRPQAFCIHGDTGGCDKAKIENKKNGNNKRKSAMMFFGNIHYNTHCHFSRVNLKLGKIIEGTLDASVEVFIAASYYAGIKGNEVNHPITYANAAFNMYNDARATKKEFILSSTEGSQQVVDITDVWIADTPKFSVIESLFIMLRPKSDDDVPVIEMNHNFELEILGYQIIVPKSINELAITSSWTSDHYKLHLNVGKVMVATGFKIVNNVNYLGDLYCAVVSTRTYDEVTYLDRFYEVSFDFPHWQGELAPNKKSCFKMRNGINLNERFVDFPQPFKFKYMSVILIKLSGVNFHNLQAFMGSMKILGGEAFDHTNDPPPINYPIFSAGLHDQNPSTGVNIFLNQSNNMISADVQTKSKRYHVETTNTGVNEYSIVTVVWKNAAYLQIYVDNTLKNEDSSGRSHVASVDYQKSYYVFFGYYEFAFSYLYAKFQFFFVMRKEITGSDAVAMFEEADFFPIHPKSTGSLLLGPNCICKSSVCPCETGENLVNQTFSPYTYTLSQYQSDTLYYSTMQFYDDNRKGVRLVFPITGMNLKYFKITDARLKFKLPYYFNTCFFLSWYSGRYEFYWCQGFNQETVYETKNVADYITWIAKKSYLENNNKIILYFESSSYMNHLPKSVTLALTTAEPSPDLLWYEPAYNGALNTLSTRKEFFTTNANFRMNCLKFSAQFVGDGFAFVVITREYDESTPIMTLLPQNYKAWTEVSISIVSAAVTKFHLTFIRSGSGDGYFAIKNLRTLPNDVGCESFEDYQAVTTTFDNLKNALDSNNLPVPIFIAPNDQELNPLYDSTRVIASNSVPSKSYNIFMDSYLLPKKSKTSEFTISIEGEKLHDFTLTAALFQMGFIKIVFQSAENQDQTVLEFRRVANERKMNLTITNVISNSTQETIMHFRQFAESMKFFGIQYSSLFKRIRVLLNKDHHDVYWNLNLTDITTMAISTKKIVCLQFYDKILDAREYEVTKLCPTYVSSDMCAGTKPRCHAIFCNPTTGKYEWKESRRFYNEDCSHSFDDTLDTTGYFPMDFVNNSGFIENVKDELSIEFNHTFMSLSEPGVVDNALCYKSDKKNYLIKKSGLCSGGKCSFSVWLKHACVTDGHLFTIQRFTVRCKANGEVEIQVEDCIYTYMFSTSFWYHLAAVSKLKKLESVYYNGQQKHYKSKVCNADKAENNFLIFGNIPLCVDELTYSEKAYDSEFVYNRYIQSKVGNATTVDEIKRQSSQLHIYYGDYDQIGYNGYHENYMFLPPYLQGFRDRFQSEMGNALQHIEFSNMWHGNKPIAVCYFKTFDGLSWQASGRYDFAIGSESFASAEAAIPENDIKRSSEKAVAQSYTIIDIQKTNVTISWNHLKEYISDRSYPLIGIKIMVTSNLPTKYLEVFSPTFLIDQLRPYKTYTLYLIPISTKGIAQNFYLQKSFTTQEGEPYAAPHLTCSSIDINKVNRTITSTIHDITTEEYGGTPYSLQYFLYDSNNITDPALLDTWNLPQALSEKEYLRSAISSGSDTVSFHTELPYHDYYIVSRATTQNGSGLGILNYLTCKSAQGAAEYPPTVLNASTEYGEDESFNVNWIPLPDDDKVWHSNQRKYVVRFGYIYLRSSQNDFRSSSSFFWNYFSSVTRSNAIFKLTDIVSNLPSSNTNKVPDYRDNVYRFYVGTSISTPSNYYSVYSPYYCIALENRNAPRSLELNSYPTPMNSTSIQFHFKKQNPLFWRGMKKFFVVLATQCPEKNCTMDIPSLNISTSLYTFCLNYLNPNATNELKPTHLSESNFKHYCHHIDVGNDLEGFIQQARLCSELEYVPRKWNDQEFAIHGLLHYRMYKLNVYACNEFDCTLTSDNNTETHQYIPSYPPAGFSHNALTSTSIKFYWNEIDKYHQNGIILNYTINLRRTRTNEMIYNTTSNRSIVYENLEKYEKVCISVAGNTIIGEGVRSSEYCAYTAEDAPSIAPKVSKVDLHSHHIGIWVNKPPSVYPMNGIVREIKAVFVPSVNNTYSIYGKTNSRWLSPTTPLLMRKRRSVKENAIEQTLPTFHKTWYINHENFFRTLEDKRLTLNGLAAYTQYDMSLAFNTILDGEISSSVTFRTLQSVPLEPPHSVEVDYFNSIFFNITWEPLQLHLWAGIPYQYCVVVDELWRNSSVQTNRFCYESNTLNHSSYYLQPFTVHQITVFACTSIGCSNLGVKTSVFTNESAPVGLVNNLTYSLTSTSLKLNWTDVEIMQQYGVITGYKLTIVASDNLHPPIETFVNVSETLFSNLREYTWYVVTIQAINSAGDGPSYVEHYRTLEDVPSAPPNETLTEGIDANRILITWNNVPYHHRNGIIRGYLIYYHKVLLNGSLGPRQIRNINGSLVFSYVLDGLVKGDSYNISVAAYTSVGVGVESAMIFSETGDFDDGNWTLWTEWGGCSATCGGGIQIRTRECENPRPFNGGANCTGISVRYKECGGVACSGIFLSEPGNMNCTKFCSSVGTLCQQNIHTENTTDVFRKNNVTCSANTVNETWTDVYDPVYKVDEGICKGYVSVPDIIQCDGNSSSDMNTRRVCNCLSQDDIGFSIWGQWSPCVRTCHVSSKIRAYKQRRRACLFPKREDQELMNICTGVRIQLADCEGVTNCPVDGNWGEWTEFGPCNQTCNYGYRKRTRECDSPRPKFGGEYCKGFPESLQLGGCNNFPCPVHGRYSNWEEWSYCQSPCGNSTRYRRRFCNSPTPNYRGRNCDLLGHDIEHENCTKDPCPNVDMICELRLYERYFDWHYNYIDSEESKELQQMIKHHFWKEFMSRIEFEKFRKGSVIAEFTIYYDGTGHDQVVQLMEQAKSQKIGNSSFSDFKINSTTIPCLPPTNITTYTVSQSSLMITFDIQQCRGGAQPTNIYLYYQLKTAPANSAWTVAGFHPNRTFISLNHLEANMKLRGYLFRATIFGNGPPSEELFMETVVGAPSQEPKNVRAVSVSPTQIFVEWEDIPEAYRNGPLIGYKVRYKTIAEKTFQEKNVDFGYRNTLVENLKPFTMYQMEVSGFTRGGEGPLEYVIEKTLEGVPDIPVPNFKVYDMQSVDWWAVSWSEIPKENVNGILRGYRLMCYMSYRSDISIGGEPTVIKRQFDIYTFYHKEINLVNYATYNVTVTGFTNAGNGPVPEYFAKTCKCLKDLYSFWYPLKPYVETNGTHLSGFFPGLIKDLIEQSCGSCKDYEKSTLHFMITRTGDDPNWLKELNLKLAMTPEVDVGFPFYSKPGRTVAPDTTYIQINPSIGFTMLVRDEAKIAGKVDQMILNVLKVWPLLLVSYCIATLFGILIWFTDQFMNPDEFNIGSSIKGPVIGFWFSFVTMTTVGYGDLTPRSILARSIAMVWFLVGLILNGIVIGFIATALTSVGLPEEVTLYDSKAGVILDTYEYRYAIRKNAIVSDNVTYENVTSMLKALQESEVDLVIADAYQLGDVKSQLPSMNLKVKKTIDEGTGYGFALSGQSKVLKPDIEGLLLLKNPLINKFIKSMEDKVPRMELEQPGEATKDIFSAEADAFQKSAIYMCSFIAVGTVLGIVYTCYKNNKKKIQVSPTKIETNAEEFRQLGLFIKKTYENLCEITDRYGNLHKEEIEKLASFKKAYKRKVNQVGSKEADKIVFDAFG